jgi:structure-specific endonuclease subunit SLX1
MFTCYLISNVENTRTYIGATKDFPHRLRQHNGIIKGGAKATRGKTWYPLILVSGFSSWNELLSFEWHWRHQRTTSKKVDKTADRLAHRIEALNIMLDNKNYFVNTTIDIAPLIICDQVESL